MGQLVVPIYGAIGHTHTWGNYIGRTNIWAIGHTDNYMGQLVTPIMGNWLYQYMGQLVTPVYGAIGRTNIWGNWSHPYMGQLVVPIYGAIGHTDIGQNWLHQ